MSEIDPSGRPGTEVGGALPPRPLRSPGGVERPTPSMPFNGHPDEFDSWSDESLIAYEAQWDAVRLLVKANVLHLSGWAMKGSELFWPGTPGQQWTEYPRVHPPGARPRNDGQPVFVLSLSKAIGIKKLEAMFEWLAGQTSEDFFAHWLAEHNIGDSGDDDATRASVGRDGSPEGQR